MQSRIFWLGAVLALTACVPAPAAPTGVLLPLPPPAQRTARATQAPTPIIIASATPPPTPVTYAVQAGDTLIGIAVKFGVALSDLEAANPGLEARFLSVGAVLVIPISGTVIPAGFGAPDATPVPLEVSVPACYPITTGAIICLVQLGNPGPAAVEGAAARVTLAGADGLPLAVDIGQAGLDVIPPGGTAPVAVLFAPAPAGVAAVGAEVIAALPAGDTAGRLLPLEIVSHSGSAAGDQWTIIAELHNPAAAAVGRLRVIVTLAGRDGALVGYRQRLVEPGLGPGERRAFTLTVAALAEAASYVIQVEGRP